MFNILLLTLSLVYAQNKAGSSDATTSVITEKPVGFAQSTAAEIVKIEDCTVKNKYEICQKILNPKKGVPKPLEALAAYKKSCEIKEEGCVKIYSYVAKNSPESIDALHPFLETQCAKNIEACHELTFILEVKKDYSNAINYARKYFLQKQSGNFIKLSYKYGDKSEAIVVALNSCKSGVFEQCVFVLGLSEVEQVKHQSAYDGFCKITQKTNVQAKKLQEVHCFKPLSKIVPKPIKIYAEFEVKKLLGS